jgi:hypothetical protein
VPFTALSGTASTTQIPNLDASKITSGVFTAAQIPNLDFSKITTGAVPPAQAGAPVGGAAGQVLTKNTATNYDYAWSAPAGNGTVTSVSSGNLSPLFNVSVSNPTTTPAFAFSLLSAPANSVFNNLSASTAAPSFSAMAALTATNDTNVTLTLGGTPATSLMKAVSITAGWTGVLAPARGGTGAATAPANTYFGNNTGSTGPPSFVAQPAYASVQTAAVSPAGSTSTTGVMMGLGSNAKITPTATGKVRITISGTIYNGVAGALVQALIQYGTGTAPANGAATTGTGTGVGPARAGTGYAANQETLFSSTVIVTGLTVSTQYWIDVTAATASGGATAIKNTTVAAVELP